MLPTLSPNLLLCYLLSPFACCRQLVSAYAEEQATQDAVYYLGEALRRSVLDLDTYLRHVRALSRKQYQLRATMTLCRQRANLAG